MTNQNVSIYALSIASFWTRLKQLSDTLWESNAMNNLESQDLFDKGYYCAEGVLMQIAKENGIESPLIPAIATGFCAGVSRTSGTCGALSGGILALNVVLGRRSERESAEGNFNAVKKLVEEFTFQCGTANCTELLGCDIGTSEGQQHFGKNALWSRCREFVGKATLITQKLIAESNAVEKA